MEVNCCFAANVGMLRVQGACRGGCLAEACRAAARASTPVVRLAAPPPWRRWTEHAALAWWSREMHAHGCSVMV